MSTSESRFPISRPTPGAGGATGAWRTKKPVINISLCVYCGLCDVYCPTSSITVMTRERKIEVNYDYCKGCGLCASVCPRKAITMVEE
jgi:pyruvate ferredoxin oxidoreductase delta subunit